MKKYAKVGLLSVFLTILDLYYTLLIADLLTILQGGVSLTIHYRLFGLESSQLTLLIIFAIFMRFAANDYLYFDLYKKIYSIYCQKITQSLDSRFKDVNSSEIFDEAGRAVKNYTTDINIFIGGFLAPIVQLSIDLLVISGLFIYFCIVFEINFLVMSITLLSIVFLGLIIKILSARVQLHGLRRNEVDDKKSRILTELSGNWRSLIDLNATGYFKTKLDLLNKDYADSSIGISRNLNLTKITIETYFGVILGVLALLATDSVEYSPATASAAVAFVLRLFPTINRAGQSIIAVKSSKGALQSLENYKPVNSVSSNVALHDLEEQLIVESFSINDGSTTIIRGANLSIPKNKLSVIRSPSGAGKTLFLQALYKELRSRDCRVAYISQNSSLFSVPVYENMFLTTEKGQEKYKSALDILSILGFSSEKAEKVLSEKFSSKQLSGGEAQRIYLSRYIQRDFDYLLLDEVTSALDGDTEKSIIQQLDKITENCTVVLNAHSKNAAISNVNQIQFTQYLK